MYYPLNVAKSMAREASVELRLTLEEAITTIQGAFKPLRCIAQIWDYEKRIRFRILDTEGGLLLTGLIHARR